MSAVEPELEQALDAERCTCYLGHAGDPAADEEACTVCDGAFWRDPVYRLEEPAEVELVDMSKQPCPGSSDG